MDWQGELPEWERPEVTFPQISGRLAMDDTQVVVREVQLGDFERWKPLWDGYNAFYGRHGDSALPEDITQVTWQRFLDPNEPVFALVAELEGQLIGMTHFLFHRSTTRKELTCYLQDLFTSPSARGQGVGRLLIEAAHESCRNAGIGRLYWQTHESNAAARLLYDKVATFSGFIVYSREATVR